jgi:hypothetical protein
MSRLMMTGAAMLLASCATLGKPGSTLSNVAVEAQAIAVQICGFEPTVDTVLQILSTGNPGLQAAEAVANAICRAVTSTSAVDAGETDNGYIQLAVYREAQAPKKKPSVNGVVVHGRFVK